VGRPLTLGWRLVDGLCSLLEADERAAVCGDLAESRVPVSRALREVAGLIVRRHAALWLGWRPWVALATIVLPLGFLLSVASRWFADGTAFNVSLYVRTGDWAYFAIPGWRRDVFAAASVAIVSWLALAAWSWTAGFVLGGVSRRAWWSVAGLFAFVVLFTTFAATTTGQQGYPGGHFRPIGLSLTGVMRVLLVLLPAFRGMHAAREPRALRRWSSVGIALMAMMLTVLAAELLEGSLIFGWGIMRPQPGPDGIVGTADDLRPLWWISLVMTWPAVFMVLARMRGFKTSVSFTRGTTPPL
jgi:hypothetical protein